MAKPQRQEEDGDRMMGQSGVRDTMWERRQHWPHAEAELCDREGHFSISIPWVEHRLLKGGGNIFRYDCQHLKMLFLEGDS